MSHLSHITRAFFFGILLSAGGCDSATEPTHRDASPAAPAFTANASTWTVGTEPGDHLSMSGTQLLFNANNGGFPSMRASLVRDGDDLSIYGARSVSLLADTLLTLSAGYPTATELLRLYNAGGSDQGGILSGHLRVTGDASGANWGLDVTDGGARFGSNSFVPSSLVSSGQTSMTLVYHNGSYVTYSRVQVGASNSAGSGYRTLRVPN